MTQFNQQVDREMSWDDTLTEDGKEFKILPAGDYPFTVVSFERGRHNGSEKLPACHKAIVLIKIVAPNGDEAEIRHQLFLHTSTQGMISQFFGAIGMKKKGEPAQMNWNLVPGSTGTCKVGIKTYNGNEYNDIKTFYYKEQTPQFTQPQQPYVQPMAQPMYQQPQQAQPAQQQVQPQQGNFKPGQF